MSRDPADRRAIWRAADGDVVDQIARAVYGHEGRGRTEALLEANPGLAEIGPLLTAGTEVAIPADPAPAAAQRLRLWS